jgi:hypothetical protein
MILESGVRGIRPYDVEALKAVAAAGDGDDGIHRRDYFNIEFERADRRVQCTLYVKIDWQHDREREEDADGNTWSRYRVTADVSWPSHGTTSLTQARARVDLYQEVVRLATEVAASFPNDVMKIRETRAQREEAKRDQAKREVEAAAKRVVAANAKGLRVGQFAVAVVSDADVALLAGAVHAVDVDDRCYEVNAKVAADDPTIHLRRIAPPAPVVAPIEAAEAPEAGAL